MLIALASGQPWRFAYNCRSRFVRGTDYFSILERGINGVYYHVSHEHLPTYLAEFDFRYNARSGLGISDPQRAGKLLKGILGPNWQNLSSAPQLPDVLKDAHCWGLPLTATMLPSLRNLIERRTIYWMITAERPKL